MGGIKSELTVVKLGGSLVTHKDRPLALNMKGIEAAARGVAGSFGAKTSPRLMLIHGGGSFGHYYAKKYRVSTKPRKVSAYGASRIAGSMIDLHSVVLGALLREKVPCKTILTSEFLTSSGSQMTPDGMRYLDVLFRNGFVPITYGNISIQANGSSIISGDQIGFNLAKQIGIQRMIYAMDVDGIYPGSDLRGSIIEELGRTSGSLFRTRKYDVTGGIRSKIYFGFKLASLGTDVYFVNGTKEERLRELIKGKTDVYSTRITSKGR